MDEIETKIRQAELETLQKHNELLDLEIELQKVVIVREQVFLEIDRCTLNKTKETNHV